MFFTIEHLKGSIYQYIEKELKLKIQSSHKTIRAHLSSPLEQEQLGLKEYEPYIEMGIYVISRQYGKSSTTLFLII